MPLAVNVSGLPVSPVALAVKVFVPATVPSVQFPTAAIPLPLVVALPPTTEPPPVPTAKVTLIAATPLPFTSVTLTDGATLSAAPATAD